MRKIYSIFVLFCILAQGVAYGQDSSEIDAQKRKIAELERKISSQEQEISKIQKGRTSTESKLRSLANQIESRNDLLEATEKSAKRIERERDESQRRADSLADALDENREQYAEMVREAYRNYQHNNYITYILSSDDFTDIARRITYLRRVAQMREAKLALIDVTSIRLREQQQILDQRKDEAEATARKLSDQRSKLQRDSRNAKATISQLSKRERAALQKKSLQEQELSVAISELRRLSKGNKEGASFSSSTSGLSLPVVAGRVKQYRGNMAEIVGAKGSNVISIYDGKVVDIKLNRITNKYDLFIASGEYISSYANMGSVAVKKGDVVARNQRIGTIGSSVDLATMNTEYKLIFGIYPPDPKKTMSAKSCFVRK